MNLVFFFWGGLQATPQFVAVKSEKKVLEVQPASELVSSDLVWILYRNGMVALLPPVQVTAVCLRIVVKRLLLKM